MLYLFVLVPITVAVLLLFLPNKVLRWLALMIYAAMLGFSIYLFVRTRFYNEIITATTGGAGILGIALYCDLTASIFLVLVCFLFVCFFFYSAIRDKSLERFNFFLTILQALIILVILSRDLFNIFVAIEVATIVCSILIMFKKENRSIYDGLVYMLINNLGMLFFLMGIGLIYRQFGVLDIGRVAMLIQANPGRQILLAYAFIMTGVCLKCALIPVHMWLPHAHGTAGAPTVVSAILSGLYVKGGIYIFIRMRAMFLPAVNMDMVFIAIGILTALIGIVMAIMQKDIKLILAYHTISQIGLIVFGLSLNNDFGSAGAMLHIINHALFKSLLFLSAGVLVEHYNTRDISEIKGVLRTFPVVGFAIIAGILGITGAPLFNGSISKYFIQSGAGAIWLEIAFNIINLGTILSFIKFGQVLWGPKKEQAGKNDGYSNTILLILSSLCFLTGILGSPFIYLLFGERYSIDIIGYLTKVIIWVFSFALAAFIYKHFISRLKIDKMAHAKISFNGMAMSVVALFVVLVSAGIMLY